MDTLAFDGRMGASGDMLLGALLAIGADPAVLDPVEDALDVRYAVDEVTKNGIRATSVTVARTADAQAHSHGHSPGHSHDDGHHDDEEHDHSHAHDHTHDDGQDHSHAHDHTHDDGQDHSHAHDHPHDDGQDHPHDHDHTHDHSHDHSHSTAEGRGPNRTYPEVVALVEEMDLPAGVERDAKAVFEILGAGEAAVHGTDLADTHFHEVGADDAIADVVGVALLLADLDVDRIVTTPVATGGGEVTMSHGVYPVPAPAVVEIAGQADWSVRGGPLDAELLTPTGAAVLAHYAEGVEAVPTLDVEATGYGAGTKDFAERANVLRAIAGTGEGGLTREDIAVLETNLDDATPEVLGGLQESLQDAGAHDVSIIPATMKKSRPGHLVKVIADPGDAERVARRLAAETGTLGVRAGGATHRWIASREFQTVDLSFGEETYEVCVKVASDESGAVYDVSAEYDDAAAVAREAGVPVREVMRAAENAVASPSEDDRELDGRERDTE